MHRTQLIQLLRKLPLLLIVLLAVQAFTGFINAQTLKFAFITDLHVAPGLDNENALHDVVNDINSKPFDFVVVTGDLTNTGSNAELISVKNAFDKLNKPLLIIPGNHETNWSESAGMLFNQLWGNDRFLFRKNGFLLVGFNTGPFMKMGDGHVKQEDLQWLRNTLKSSHGETLVAFSHYPVADGLDNWTDVAGILKAHNCLISFCGHGHKLSLLNFDGIPGIMGRALKDAKGFGYNVVEIHPEKTTVSEILINSTHQPAAIEYAFNSSRLNELPVSVKPDYTINTTSPVKTAFEYSDTVSIFSGLCLAGDSLVIYGNSAGWVKAIRTCNKEIAWQKQFQGAIYSTPVVAAGMAVFGTSDGYIRGIDIRSGREKWLVYVQRPVLADGMAEKKHVYIGGGDKAFYKIDARTGEIIWRFDGIKGTVQGIPAISGNCIVFGAWDIHLYCLNKKTGQLLWKWNNGKNQPLLSPGNIAPAISDNKVFIVAPDRFFTALHLKTGKEIWRTNKHRVRESMGMSSDGKLVYAKLMNDSIIAVNTTGDSFELNWAVNAGTGYDHNPCPVAENGKLVAGATKNGLIVAIDSKTQAILWKYKTGNSLVNKLVFNGETLWYTTSDGKIVSLTHIL